MPHIIYKLISTTVNLYDSGQYVKETTTTTNSNEYLNELQDAYSLNNSLSLNDTSNSTSYVPYEKRPETYIIPILFSVIFLLGS